MLPSCGKRENNPLHFFIFLFIYTNETEFHCKEKIHIGQPQVAWQGKKILCIFKPQDEKQSK